MKVADYVFIGIKGQVLALDRVTGQQVWTAKTKGSSFVNVVLDGDRILAASSGELFCFDALTGAQIWQNKLPGLGMGLISIATANAPAGNVATHNAAIEAEQAAADAALLTSIPHT